MNKPTTKTEPPCGFSARRFFSEYIDLKRSNPVSVVDVLAWFSAAATGLSSIYYLCFGVR